MFTRFSIPTPFQVGPVNAYLAGRTLIDPGPGSEEAWAALLDELESHDMGPTDVEQVLVTHPHPDHFGLAERLSEAGARVLASPTTAEIIADFEARLDYEQSFFVDFFERHGMARSTAQTITDLPEVFLDVAPGVETDATLDDGETVEVAGTALTAEAVQGHAPGETIFTYETDEGERAIVGDHVLPDITPNPLLQPPAEEGGELPTGSESSSGWSSDGGERPRVLPAFNRSLANLRERDFDRFLPGHREEITAPGERIDEILAAHEERTENVREIVAGGPTTAVEVMEELFSDLPATEYFSGMSEAVGHLDVLDERGEVGSREQGGVVVWEVTE
ncbi:MBL fold metallo-hydrolase [Halorussus gelatinilyticus]|uniref:MBL fold metallo-hydrolase n=1 Tax=Halorussus gelatinilyticus TaxID=2937524 RepID=A0A8U0IHX0_9EURY|nr:MBL fold metallo-hydrolase [Halorussus gelatinilyticus]UPW00700.1 MBL fold metallo-hydrolase [Halorussus gelatinilyticus]